MHFTEGEKKKSSVPGMLAVPIVDLEWPKGSEIRVNWVDSVETMPIKWQRQKELTLDWDTEMVEGLVF